MKVLELVGSFIVMSLMMSCQASEKASSRPHPRPMEAPVKSATTVTASSASSQLTPSPRRGKLIYKQYCNRCHGIDGTLGLSGAKDLSISDVSLEERVNQITNGKGLMTPYKGTLSEEQILAVAQYIEVLRVGEKD